MPLVLARIAPCVIRQGRLFGPNGRTLLDNLDSPQTHFITPALAPSTLVCPLSLVFHCLSFYPFVIIRWGVGPKRAVVY